MSFGFRKRGRPSPCNRLLARPLHPLGLPETSQMNSSYSPSPMPPPGPVPCLALGVLFLETQGGG